MDRIVTRPDKKFRSFRKLPTEIRYIVTSYLTWRETFRFLKTHRGAYEDVCPGHAEKNTFWDLCFKNHKWLDKMVARGLTPALLGWDLSRVDKPGGVLKLALLLIGHTKDLDWVSDREELIQTLRSQQGFNEFSVSSQVRLHIGQPFGRTGYRNPWLLVRQVAVKGEKRDEGEHKTLQTLMVYYNPRRTKRAAVELTELCTTTAKVSRDDDWIQVRDAKQPSLTWDFMAETAPDRFVPLLPGGEIKIR
ncbi:hypothetical protein B0J13DRAFT_662719 [Dactylonectria estremocensis]|uniref:F-box domain-containing protein n=1 Tax=Dactylonectria estremocensis TaxID=1079267 RepID=A0A9P9CZ38_9HYPO|nr:hypothetical protein B0J13DRAFT_662719 [Dactylonectria estremocensis]